jgi:hypothetical protein
MIVDAVYDIPIVQKIRLEPDARPRTPLAIVWPLTALTVLICLQPAPFLLFAVRLVGFAGAEGAPQFETPWAPPVLVPDVGGLAVDYGWRRGSISSLAECLARLPPPPAQAHLAGAQTPA